jgi:hypothetical protein
MLLNEFLFANLGLGIKGKNELDSCSFLIRLVNGSKSLMLLRSFSLKNV